MPRSIRSEINDILILDRLFQKIKEDGNNKSYKLNFENTKCVASELYGYYHFKVNELKKYNIEIIVINVHEDVDAAIHLTVKYKDEPSPRYLSAIYSKNFSDDLNNENYDCFDLYLKKEFLPKCINNKFIEDLISPHLSELFVNARTHGKTNNIICGGQIYSKIKKIKFVIVDFGVTIPYKISNHKINNKENYFNDNDSGAIKWATMQGNTTKIEKIGGLGLAFITNFLDENKGRIQIISRRGSYEYSNKKGKLLNFNKSFNGTFIVIELDIDELSKIKRLNKNVGTFSI